MRIEVFSPYRAAVVTIYELAGLSRPQDRDNIGEAAISLLSSPGSMEQQNNSYPFTFQIMFSLLLRFFAAGGSDAHVRPPECAQLLRVIRARK